MKFDYIVAEFADSGFYSRDRLTELIGPKLNEADRAALATVDHDGLSRIVGAAGLTAATTVAVFTPTDATSTPRCGCCRCSVYR